MGNTGRLHMSSYKKQPSILKQAKTKKINEENVQKGGVVGTYSGSASAGELLGGVNVPDAIGGGTPGTPWENKIKNLYREGASIQDLVDKGHGTPEGLGNLLAGIEQKPRQTEGSMESSFDPKKTEAKKGEYADTYTAYDSRQALRNLTLTSNKLENIQQRLRMNENKLSKIATKTNGEWVAKNPKDQNKVNRLSTKRNSLSRKEEGRKQQYENILRQTKQSKNPNVTLGYEVTDRRPQAKQAGGEYVKATGTETTAESLDAKLKKFSQGTGDTQTTKASTFSEMAADFNSKLKSGAYDIDKSNLQGISLSNAGSLLKKTGYKMKGYGNKTYKK